MMRARLSVGIGTVLCLGLQLTTGCGSIGARPASTVHTYQLAYPSPPPASVKLPAVVRVGTIRSAALYDRDTIVYRDTPHTTSTYFYHRWATRPATLLTDLLTRDLIESQRYQAVAQTPSLLAADFLLQGQLEEIEEIPAESGCQAHLRLSVVVTRLRPSTQAVVFQKSYSGDEPCPCNAPGEVVAAMSRVTAELSRQIQADLAAAIERESGTRLR